MWRASDGAIALRQRFSGDATRVVVTHRASVVAQVVVIEGSMSFLLASGEIHAPPQFVLAIPPRSVLPIRFTRAVVQSDGLGSLTPLAGAAELRVLRSEVPFSASGLLAGERIASLDADAEVPTRIVRTRERLHTCIDQRAPVRIVATEVGMAPETLSRGFARAYGLPPKQYCTRARLFDATLYLFTGVPIVSAALEAGFNDLSRFYAQFRRVLGSTPGVYARIRNRQDQC
jgi:AraC-like DNA-binding protein